MKYVDPIELVIQKEHIRLEERERERERAINDK